MGEWVAAVGLAAAFWGIRWLIKRGWRSTLGLAEKRSDALGEAFCTDRMECGCSRNGKAEYGCLKCGAVRCSDHYDPHTCPPEKDELLAIFNAAQSDHFEVWEAECSQIRMPKEWVE